MALPFLLCRFEVGFVGVFVGEFIAWFEAGLLAGLVAGLVGGGGSPGMRTPSPASLPRVSISRVSISM